MTMTEGGSRVPEEFSLTRDINMGKYYLDASAWWSLCEKVNGCGFIRKQNEKRKKGKKGELRSTKANGNLLIIDPSRWSPELIPENKKHSGGFRTLNLRIFKSVSLLASRKRYKSIWMGHAMRTAHQFCKRYKIWSGPVDSLIWNLTKFTASVSLSLRTLLFVTIKIRLGDLFPIGRG